MTRPFAPIEDAVAAIGRGEIVVVVDDEDRENEGDLIMAAEHATPEKIAFFLPHTSGVICVPLTGERADELDLPADGARTTPRRSAPPSPSASTTATAPPPASRPPTGPPPSRRSIDPAHPARRPRPARATSSRCATAPGGVLKRAGHTEATVDLARMAGLYPAGVLCEIVTRTRRTWPGCPSSSGSPRSTACCSSPSPT